MFAMDASERRTRRMVEFRNKCERIISYLSTGKHVPALNKNQQRTVRAQSLRHIWDSEKQQLFVRGEQGQGNKKPVTNEEEVLDIIRRYHGEAFGVHSGINATLAKISHLYTWNGMKEDIKDFVMSCDWCQRFPKVKTEAPEFVPIRVKDPLELVGMDFIGPLPMTTNGNKYVCTFTDYYTKFVDLFPLKEKAANVVSDAIKSFVCRWGAPECLLSDQGKEFVAKINDEVRKKFGIERLITGARHPPGSGSDSRAEQALKRRLSELMSVTEGSGLIPEVSKTDVAETLNAQSNNVTETIKKVQVKVEKVQKREQERHAKRKSVEIFNFESGDLVLRNIAIEGVKMEPLWCDAYSMASSAKKRALGLGENPQESDDSTDESPGEGGDSSGEDSKASEEEINEEVTVDFEAHAVSHNDFNGIKKLLQQLFLKAHVNTSEMADLIIQQSHLGSVIKQAEVPEDSDDDDDPDEVFGFITVLNLTERKGVQCVEQLKELILDRCEKSSGRAAAEQLERTLGDAADPVGLLLSERFVNVPPQIALPLHKQLQEEIGEAERTDKPSGKCRYFLMISKTCKEAGKSVPARGSAPKDQYVFINAEEEFFYEHAVSKFHFSVQEDADSCLSGRWSFEDVPMKPFRTVMLIPADRMPAIMDKLKEYLTV
ncbi:protein BCCIP homolog isoform X2 [Syngnathoides biaculeatus]|uniref:protein BCCIP homolog isoform X2 n=1 Tax=Syngnathoides biaculeatus TaxID=300417 RepID=UPI002ADDD6D5|nr:protein BCCIP homolog isoform X2 [Syngnathoides biaculeatus]